MSQFTPEQLYDALNKANEAMLGQADAQDTMQALAEYLQELTKDARGKRTARVVLGIVITVIASIYILYFPFIYTFRFFGGCTIDSEFITAYLKTVPWAIGLLGVVVIFYHPSKTVDKLLDKMPFGK